MRDIFRRLLLNYETDHNNYNRFVFDSAQNYNQYPSNSDQSTSTRHYQQKPRSNLADLDADSNDFYGHFNSDTRLNALGGLSIWQFTAVLMAIIFGIGMIKSTLVLQSIQISFKFFLIQP